MGTLIAFGFSGVMLATMTQAIAWQPGSRAVRKGTIPLELGGDQLRESSGLAFSHVKKDCVWSHNDSGGKPRLYAFNQKGKCCGHVELKGVRATDWEDMASFDDGGPRLLVADVGDNDCHRQSVSLYLFDEPDPHKKTRKRTFQHIRVTYPSGPANCESVTVDLEKRLILLLTKSPLGATLHAVDLPPANFTNAKPDVDGSDSANSITLIESEAEPIGVIAIPMATGMDLCPITGDLWITSYFQAYRYPVTANRPQMWTERIRGVPQAVSLPQLRQVEALAVDEMGRIWVTSEGNPTKMQRLTP